MLLVVSKDKHTTQKANTCVKEIVLDFAEVFFNKLSQFPASKVRISLVKFSSDFCMKLFKTPNKTPIKFSQDGLDVDS